MRPFTALGGVPKVSSTCHCTCTAVRRTAVSFLPPFFRDMDRMAASSASASASATAAAATAATTTAAADAAAAAAASVADAFEAACPVKLVPRMSSAAARSARAASAALVSAAALASAAAATAASAALRAVAAVTAAAAAASAATDTRMPVPVATAGRVCERTHAQCMHPGSPSRPPSGQPAGTRMPVLVALVGRLCVGRWIAFSRTLPCRHCMRMAGLQNMRQGVTSGPIAGTCASHRRMPLLLAADGKSNLCVPDLHVQGLSSDPRARASGRRACARSRTVPEIFPRYAWLLAMLSCAPMRMRPSVLPRACALSMTCTAVMPATAASSLRAGRQTLSTRQ